MSLSGLESVDSWLRDDAGATLHQALRPDFRKSEASVSQCLEHLLSEPRALVRSPTLPPAEITHGDI